MKYALKQERNDIFDLDIPKNSSKDYAEKPFKYLIQVNSKDQEKIFPHSISEVIDLKIKLK